MIKELLKEVVVITVGKQAELIADLLNSNSHVNEFTIAKKLDLTINQTRNILYKISDFGLVSSVRKKDKKKGWYTYSWKFEIIKCLEFLRDLYMKKFEELDKELSERIKGVFYTCKRCNIEVDEEKALLMDFTCEECGDVFTVKDNSKLVKDLEKNLEKIKERINLINKEIEKEMAVLEKKKEKEIKKIEKEKKDKRKKAADKRAATKRKTAVKKASSKKTTEKAVKKKTPKKKATKKKVAKKKAVKKKTPKKKATKKKVPKKK